jgi:predicted lipoprotein with Yx(FWY)xxD motif
MMKRNLGLSVKWLIFAAMVFFVNQSWAQVPIEVVRGVLVDQSGMTLYVFDKDVAGNGKSVCNGMCAENWPPLLAKSEDKEEGAYGIIKRDDGSAQWTHKGKPLYLWVKDKKPGDKTGDGVNKVWHVARP